MANTSFNSAISDGPAKTEIDGLLSLIEDQIVLIENNQSALETRIVTILSSGREKDGKPIEKPVVLTPLGSRLQSLLSRIEDLRLRHLDMTQRIEL